MSRNALFFFWNVVNPIIQTEHWTHELWYKFWSKDSRITWGSKKRNVGKPSSKLKSLSTWNSTKNPILKKIALNNVAYPVEKVMGLWCAWIPKGMKLLHGSSIRVGGNGLRLWAWAAQAQHGHRHLTAKCYKQEAVGCLSIPTTKTATSTQTFVEECARRWLLKPKTLSCA